LFTGFGQLVIHAPIWKSRSVGLMLYRISPKAVSVGEVEVYGEGYISQASYVGPFIDMGQQAIWGDLRWRGRQDPEARVLIQSRAGRDQDPNKYWCYTSRGSETTALDKDGNPLSASAYSGLKPGEEAGITYDRENWSFWSAPYEFADSSGTTVLSPGPNSVFQLRVDFLSTIQDGGQMEFK
jgi:hypothetical protein